MGDMQQTGLVMCVKAILRGRGTAMHGEFEQYASRPSLSWIALICICIARLVRWSICYYVYS